MINLIFKGSDLDSATDSSTDSDYQEQQENELLTFEQFLGINSPLKSNHRNVTEKSVIFLVLACGT